MSKLLFEKVGDINSTYSYMCVYFECDEQPFMEICISDERELQFKIYPHVNDMNLELKQIETITERAKIFMKKTLEDEACLSIEIRGKRNKLDT